MAVDDLALNADPEASSIVIDVLAKDQFGFIYDIRSGPSLGEVSLGETSGMPTDATFGDVDEFQYRIVNERFGDSIATVRIIMKSGGSRGGQAHDRNDW